MTKLIKRKQLTEQLNARVPPEMKAELARMLEYKAIGFTDWLRAKITSDLKRYHEEVDRAKEKA